MAGGVPLSSHRWCGHGTGRIITGGLIGCREGNWHGEQEGTALAQSALDPDRPIVGFHNLFDQGQAQSCASARDTSLSGAMNRSRRLSRASCSGVRPSFCASAVKACSMSGVSVIIIGIPLMQWLLSAPLHAAGRHDLLRE